MRKRKKESFFVEFVDKMCDYDGTINWKSKKQEFWTKLLFYISPIAYGLFFY